MEPKHAVAVETPPTTLIEHTNNSKPVDAPLGLGWKFTAAIRPQGGLVGRFPWQQRASRWTAASCEENVIPPCAPGESGVNPLMATR